VNPWKPHLRCCIPQYINYRLKSGVAITLHCQLCSTRYQPVQIEKYLKSNCVIKVPSMKIFFYEEEAITCNHWINTFFCQQKWMEHKRRELVSPWRMHCTYCGMPKGTSQVEVTSNSEKIKCIALATVELCWFEGIRQADS